MEDYASALAAAQEVIGSGKYSLYTNDEWASSWSEGPGKESIFVLGIDAVSDNGTSSLGYYYVPKKYKSASTAMGWFFASDYFLDRLGEDPDDVRWGVMESDEYAADFKVDHKGSCLKYSWYDASAGKITTANSITLIRLSEMYLIAAEAALHAGTKDDAATYLNAIRKRSPNLAPADASTISVDMILSERSKELFGEGHRFFDMMRLDRTVEFNDDLLDINVTRRGKTIDRTNGMIVLPISRDEMNANPAIAYQQNEAYR